MVPRPAVGLLAAAIVAAAAPVGGAQQIRGVVRDSGSSAPVRGAVVSVLDSAGRLGARTIADASGRFILTRPPRAARLHVIRIGFEPRDAPLVPGDTLVTLAMLRLPSLLTAMRISDREVCPSSGDRGPAFELWDQARAGLLATVVARDAVPANATTRMFKRQLAPSDGMIRHQNTRVISSYTSRPFAAIASAAVFARHGYMAETPSGRTFFAPDADVLLDPSFAAMHCFRLQDADDAHRGQVGLAFTPVEKSGRDSLVDVRGVIWIDRAEPAVRSLDFFYTELEPAAMRARAGGQVEFRTMPNGVSFIDRWSLHLPVLDQIRMAPRNGEPVRRAFRRQDRNDVRTIAIDENGGEVLSAKWPDQMTWRAAATGVRGTVMQRGEGGRSAPSPFAVVSLAGTADSVAADSTGRFVLSSLVPGRYTLLAADTALVGFVEPRAATQVVDISRDSTAEVRIEVPPLADAVRELCDDEPTIRNTTTLLLHLLLSNGPRRPVRIAASWEAAGTAAIAAAPTSIDRTLNVAGAAHLVLCRVATDRPVHLTVVDGDTHADTTVTARHADHVAVRWRPTQAVRPN